MTEKRSDYRKRQKKGLIDKVKSAFSNNDSEEVDVNPDFTKDKTRLKIDVVPWLGMDKSFINAMKLLIKRQYVKISL